MSIDATGINTLLHSPEGEPSNFSNSSDIAARLKLVRDAFGFSQRELAKRAGMTNSSISMIEQGQVSPSVHSLSRILSAYPLSLADFFHFDCKPRVRVYRSGGTQAVGGDSIQSFGQSGSQLDARIESFTPGQRTAFSSSTVDVCGLLLEGELDLMLISGTEVLAAGDSFYIPNNQLYQLSNNTDNECRLFRCSLFVRNG